MAALFSISTILRPNVNMTWSLEQLDEREAHIARLEERLEESDWILLLHRWIPGYLSEKCDHSTFAFKGQLWGCDVRPVRKRVLDGLFQRHRPALGPRGGEHRRSQFDLRGDHTSVMVGSVEFIKRKLTAEGFE